MTATKVGLACGLTYNPSKGYNFLKADTRKQVLQELRIARPGMIFISMPSEQNSSLGGIRRCRGSAKWIQKVYEARILLRFAMQVAKQQVELGNRQHVSV